MMDYLFTLRLYYMQALDEVNPVAGWMLSTGGPALLLFYKVFLTLLFGIILIYMQLKGRIAVASMCLSFGLVISAVVVIYQVVLYSL